LAVSVLSFADQSGTRQPRFMPFDKIILFAALGIVALILFWGIVTMARGGEYNVKNSNRIMRYRIIFQAAALVVILVLMWWRQGTA
jgi:hypothetical protein